MCSNSLLRVLRLPSAPRPAPLAHAPHRRRIASGERLSACREPTVSILAVRARLSIARSRGIDPREMLAEAGLTAADLEDPDGRVPYGAVERLVTAIIARLREPHGLVPADRGPPGALGVLDYACQNAPTLGDYFDRAVRYSRLVTEAFALTRRTAGDLVLVEVLASPRVPPALLVEGLECTTSVLVGRARLATGDHWKPLEMQFSYAAPPHVAKYARYFPCRARFDCAATQIVLRATDLELPLCTPDPQLGDLMRTYAEQQLAQLPDAGGVLADVVRATAELLVDGPPQLDAVAGRLGMSTRTLQRRLRMQHMTFQGLVDGTRRALALAHLAGRRTSSKEIAFLVGFTSSAAFHRAFKRWTGRTPGQWRIDPRAAAADASSVPRRTPAA